MECGSAPPHAAGPAADPVTASIHCAAVSGVEEAMRSIDSGVRDLFALSAASTSPEEGDHPLCECALLLPPQRAFRWLRRLPVLKRRAASLWRQEIARLSLHGAQAARAAAATAGFVTVLAQCGLIEWRETELMRLLVEGSYPAVLRSVLLADPTRMREHKPLLPLRIRLLLAAFAFQHLTPTNGSSDDDTIACRLQWTANVAAQLSEELMEAAVKSASSAKEASPRAISCAFCRSARGGGRATSSDEKDQWISISTSVRACLVTLQRGDSHVLTAAAVEALVALQHAIVTAGVSPRDAPTSIAALSSPPSESTQYSEPCPSPSKLLPMLARDDPSVVSIPTRQYEHICRNVTQWAASHNRVDRSAASDDRVIHPRLSTLWTLAWQKDYSRLQHSSRVHLAEAIMHCARADAFALAAAGQSPLHMPDALVTRLPGCEVVARMVASAGISPTSSFVLAFAQAWAMYDTLVNCHRRSRGAVGSSASVRTAVQALCVLYLRQALFNPRLPLEGSATRGALPNQEQGRALMQSLGYISLMLSDHCRVCRWTDLWDAVLLLESPYSSDASGLTSDGMRWCSTIEILLEAASGDDTSSIAAYLRRDLREYCLIIAHGVLVTGGKLISSGGRLQYRLVQDVEGRRAVQKLLVAMIEHFDQDWTCKLLLNALRYIPSTARREAHSQGWIGVKTLLFPAMATYLNIGCHARRSGDDQASRSRFTRILLSVAEQLYRDEVGSDYLSALLGFCCAWDDFQSSQEEAQQDADAIKWGVQAVVDMEVFPELIKHYSGDLEILKREKTSVLLFMSEVLQRASNYPRNLEPQLIGLVTRIMEAISSNESSNPGSLPENQVQSVSVLRVSHSSETLQSMLQAASTADANHMEHVVHQLEEREGLLPLLCQLKRWTLMMEAEQDFLPGHESRLQFAVLCNRLAFWAPVACQDLQLLVAPLDARLIGAVKGFTKLTLKSKPSEATASSADITVTTMPSIVRVEMAVRAYLRGEILPDLCALTTLLVDAVVRCERRSSRDEFISMIQRNSSSMIVECAIMGLSNALKSTPSFNSRLRDDGTDHIDKGWRRRALSATWRAVSALETLSSPNAVFGIPAFPWPVTLFGGELVSLWLPFFFDFVLGSGLHPASDTLVKSFINCIIGSLNRDDDDVHLGTFRSTFWLVGMLSSVQFANRLQLVAVAGADQEQYGTLQTVLSALLAKLVIVSAESIDGVADADGIEGSNHVLTIWQRPMRVGRATIQYDKLRFEGQVQILGGDIDEAVSDIFFAEAIDTPPGSPSHPKAGVMLSFPQWLDAAIPFSQAFVEAPLRSPKTSSSQSIESWERTFLHCVNDLYLPLEFNNCVFSLVRAWLFKWISINLSRGVAGSFLHALPFQVTWFQRMIRMETRARCVKLGVRSEQKVFHLVFQALALASVNTAADASAAAGAALRCLEAVELIDLSITVDFVQENGAAACDAVLAGIEGVVETAKTQVFLPIVACQLLQSPLELAVFLYVCKLGHGKNPDVSFQFLDRLRAAMKDIAEEEESAMPAALDSWQQWGCKMQVKYSCFDRRRCMEVLQVVIEMTTPGDEDNDDASGL